MAVSPESNRRELLATAERVARECLEPRAEHYDRTASHPWESWRDLWEQGFLGMAVPERYGGLGLDMLSYTMVIERLAQGCTSSAMTLHMHSVVQRFIDALCTPRQKSAFYPDVVDGGILNPGQPMWWYRARKIIPTEWMEEWDRKIKGEIAISRDRMDKIAMTPWRSDRR